MSIILEFWKRIAVEPFLELIKRKIGEELFGKIYTKDMGYRFVLKNITISIIAVVFFWSSVFSLLPDFYIYRITLVQTLFLILVMGVVNNLLIFYKSPNIRSFAFVLSFFFSCYLYFPFLRLFYSIISGLIAQTSLIYTLGFIFIWPIWLGRHYTSILGKPKMSLFEKVIYSFISGVLLEINLLPSIFIHCVGALFLPILPKYIEVKIFEGSYPEYVLEHYLRKESVQMSLEDIRFEGYHYYMASFNPFYLVRAFGDKTILVGFRGAKLPFEEQLSILPKAKKEYSIYSNVYLTEIEENKIKVTCKDIYKTKNIARSRKLTTEGISLYLPTDYENIVFTDYFGRIRPIKDEFLGENDFYIKFREPLKQNQLTIVKLTYNREFRTSEKNVNPKVDKIFMPMRNLAASRVNLWTVEVISKCGINFLTAKPSHRTLERKRVTYEFKNIKPKRTINLVIRFGAQQNGKEIPQSAI